MLRLILYWFLEKAMAPHSSTLAWKIHGWRSLVGCSPWGREEADTTERLHFHFSLSFIGEGNSKPLQCSCLENPRDGEAWWAAIYGVAQSRTWLKQLSIYWFYNSICSVAKLYLTLCDPMDYSPPGSSVLPSPRVCSNSRPLSWWCYLTISSSATYRL